MTEEEYCRYRKEILARFSQRAIKAREAIAELNDLAMRYKKSRRSAKKKPKN